MKILGISGTITGSKTEIAIKKILEIIKERYSNVEVEFLNLKDFDMQFCDGRDPASYKGDTKEVINKVESADCYIIGTPIFQGSFTGALKNVFDLVPVTALRSKVMGFIATGGTYQHYLVIENQLKPIAGYFRAYVAPGHVYVHDSHFNENKELIDADLLRRLEELANETVFMQQKLKTESFSDRHLPTK